MIPTAVSHTLICAAAAGALVAGCASTTSGDPASTANNAAEPPLLPAPPPLSAADLQADYPTRYVVQPGDTLWGVAERFLRTPWRWQDLWVAASDGGTSPGPGAPRALYPGDVVEVYFQAGEPQLRLTEADRPILKLSPQVRVEAIERPVPTIPRETVSGLLKGSRVVDEGELGNLPYVVGSPEERLRFEGGALVYVRGELPSGSLFQVFRRGRDLRRVGGEYLGTELEFLGDATLRVSGEENAQGLATLQLTSTRRGVTAGDLVLPLEDEDEVFVFTPQPADEFVQGSVIAVPEGGFRVARFESVIVDVGVEDDVAVGDVLQVEQSAKVVRDPYTGESLTLEGAPAGFIMLYRVFDRVSFGLVMESEATIRLGDRVVGL